MFDVKIIAVVIILVLAAFCCGIIVGNSIQPSTAAAFLDNNATVPPLPVYDMACNNTTVNVSLGSDFLISLPENGGSTGYIWDPTSTQGLDLIESTFIPDNESLIGAPGTREWLFRASWAGEQHFKATLQRPWENQTGSEELFTLTINVS